MIPVNKVREIVSRHKILEKELSSDKIDKKKFAKISKEYSDLNEVLDIAKQYLSFDETDRDLKKILNDRESDQEMRDLAKVELDELSKNRDINEKKLKLFLLPKDEADKKNAIIEIRAGTGGLEASLFASDLFKMYEKVSNKKKWLLELISISKSDAGGLKEVIASIKGENIYSCLKFESGVHRVQRVPKTETAGRIHTSAASVAVLPEAEDVEVDLDPDEIRVEVYRSSGPGGQSVNTTDSAVKITHVPTGIIVSCQDEKSQLKNKNKAMKILRARIYDKIQAEQKAERDAARAGQIGSGDRSAKIRTYNFPQGRVTDHRITLSLYRLEEILDGDLFEFVQQLALAAQEERLRLTAAN